VLLKTYPFGKDLFYLSIGEMYSADLEIVPVKETAS
jgi:hypothetical protein